MRSKTHATIAVCASVAAVGVYLQASAIAAFAAEDKLIALLKGEALLQ